MSSALTGGDVDRRGDDAAGERGDDLLGGLDAGAVLRLGGRGAQVRRDDDVGVAEQRVVGDRLAREDVERGAGDLAGVERVLERRVVDQLAARAVDDPHAVAALGERLGVEPAARLGRLRQVDRDEVGLARRPRPSVSACSTPSSRKRSAATNGSKASTRIPKPCARAGRRAGRCGRSRAPRASSRRPRRRRTSSAPSARRSASRAPAGRCGRARASARRCARRR